MAASLKPCPLPKYQPRATATTDYNSYGLGFREVAKEITSALNLGEDEGKIDALAGSLEDAAIKSFGHSSELHTKLVSSLNQSSLLQSNRVKEFLDGERGGGTIITGELSPLHFASVKRAKAVRHHNVCT